MFESLESQKTIQNKTLHAALDMDDDGNTQSMNVEKEEMKDDEDGLRAQNLDLQRRLRETEEENERLKQSQLLSQSTYGGMPNVGLSQNLGPSMVAGAANRGIGAKRKFRDPTKCLMNPRRDKKRKKGFKFG